MIEEFKKFIMRGNVIDLAVGVIIGGAFNSIVTSLVNDILMPLVGLLLGGKDFSGLAWTVKDATINYGTFIQNIINFLIVAICMFVLIKSINNFNEKIEKLKKKKEEPKKEEKEEHIETELDILKDIRKELMKKSSK